MNDAIGQWVPASILAGALMGATALLWRMFAHRFDRFEQSIESLKERMPHVATLEQLGRLGDRFDERHTKLSDRISILENNRIRRR